MSAKPSLANETHYHVHRVEGPNTVWRHAEKKRSLVADSTSTSKARALTIARRSALAEPGVRFYVVASIEGFLVDEPEPVPPLEHRAFYEVAT